MSNTTEAEMTLLASYGNELVAAGFEVWLTKTTWGGYLTSTATRRPATRARSSAPNGTATSTPCRWSPAWKVVTDQVRDAPGHRHRPLDRQGRAGMRR